MSCRRHTDVIQRRTDSCIQTSLTRCTTNPGTGSGAKNHFPRDDECHAGRAKTDSSLVSVSSDTSRHRTDSYPARNGRGGKRCDGSGEYGVEGLGTNP